MGLRLPFSGRSRERAQSPERVVELGRPAPASLQLHDQPATAAHESSRDMQQAIAEPLRLPMLCLADQAEALEEGDQVLGCEYQLQPDLIGRELVEGEAPQPGVLAAANPVLDPGVSAVANFEGDDVRVPLISDEDLEAEPLVVS